MPELPEVEAARRAIEENCVGKKIVKAIIAEDPKVIDGVSASDFEASILGKTILSAHRKGKNMWLQLDSPPFPSFQFGMTGAVYIKGVAVTKYKRSAVKDTDEWPSKYSKFFVQLDDGLEFSFTDKRRLAKVRLLEDPASVPPISELGPDALLEPMKEEEFIESLSKKKVAIKTLLLDQSFISGIGNWVADEVLYQARIHPQQVASSMSKESCVTLLRCIKEVIEKAIEVGADSSQFPNNWIFHSREKKPGKAFVDGKKIDFLTVGGRTTAYVPELQKLDGVHAAKAGAKQKRQTSNRKDDRDDSEHNGVDESESDGEQFTENVKSKRGQKPGGQAKKPSKKRKSKESDNEDGSDDASDDDNAEKSLKTKAVAKRGRKLVGEVKKSSNKRKSKESDDENNDATDDDDDSVDNDAESQKKKPGKVANNKQTKAVKMSTKNAAGRKSNKPKKKAK